MFLSLCTKYVIVMQCTIKTTKGRPFLTFCGQYEAILSPSVYYSVIAIKVKYHILSFSCFISI